MNHPVSRFPRSLIAATVTLFVLLPVFLGVLVTLYCSFPSGVLGQESEPVSPSGQNPSTSVIWTELLQKTPYPHTAPLPPRVRTVLDGTYTKFNPKMTPPVPCRRCPDYMPEGGIWKLNLDKGIFRVFHEVTGWRSLGSFIVDGSQVQLFNDPYCTEVVGFYDWALADRYLILQAVEDRCAIGLRAKNLTQLPWRSCQPPSTQTRTNDHEPRSPGCD